MRPAHKTDIINKFRGRKKKNRCKKDKTENILKKISNVNKQIWFETPGTYEMRHFPCGQKLLTAETKFFCVQILPH